MESLEGVQVSKRLKTHFEMGLSGLRGYLCSSVLSQFRVAQVKTRRTLMEPEGFW